MTNKILFTDKEHSWTIPVMSFDFSGVTDPLSIERVIFSSKNEWSWLTMDQVLERTKNFEIDDKNKHKKFYEIVELMISMETVHKMFYLFMRNSSGMANSGLDITDEVKAVDMVKIWIKYANKLNKIIGSDLKLKLTDRLIIKIGREAKPTLFSMEDPNARVYDDTKSVIISLSPYENNDKALKEKKTSKNCIRTKHRLYKFLENKETKF